MDGLRTIRTCFTLVVFCASTSAWGADGAQGVIRFEEIGTKAGIHVQHHTRRFHGKNADVLRMFTSGGSAVAVEDYDNDGYEDLFVTDSDTGKANHLFHNNGDLTFTDVAITAGVAGGNDPQSVVSD